MVQVAPPVFFVANKKVRRPTATPHVRMSASEACRPRSSSYVCFPRTRASPDDQLNIISVNCAVYTAQWRTTRRKQVQSGVLLAISNPCL